MVRGDKGWIRVVEAFISILLVVSVLLIVLSSNLLVNKNQSSEIHEIELNILRDIQVDDDLRLEVLNENLDPVQTRITTKTPSYLECEAIICEIDGDCDLSSSQEKDIYVQSIFISAQGGNYGPKQLKLFCWEE